MEDLIGLIFCDGLIQIICLYHWEDLMPMYYIGEPFTNCPIPDVMDILE